MRPDQYYTDVIARPMSVLGRRSGSAAGGQPREVEVVAEEEVVKVEAGGGGEESGRA